MAEAIPVRNSDGTTQIGLTKFTPASVLMAQEQRMAKERESASMNNPVMDSLAGYISKCWTAAKRAKMPIETQMLKNLRMRSGTYESDQLRAIREMGGSEVYVMLTGTKCRAAESWINDVMRPIGERPWTINPTPMPDIPPELESEVRDEVAGVFRSVLDRAGQMGMMVDPAKLRSEIRNYAEKERDNALKKLQEEALERAERMSMKIDDQLVEGGWQDAFWTAISDAVTLKAGIIKGPVVRRRKTQKWVQGPQGWVVDAVDALVTEFDRVSPFDLYPAPDSRNPDDGYLIERHKLTRSDLIAMIGVPGYSEDKIRLALKEYGNGKNEMLSIDSERAMIDFGSTESLTNTEKIEALEFWGSVQGKLLKEWGMKGEIDDELEYEVNAWQVGSYVIRAILNPDKLGRKPYSVDSYERVAGSFWGKGIPELMSDIQHVCNAVARSIVNNAAFSSGPMLEINSERVQEHGNEVWPWKVFQATNQQMSESPAVRFYQPNIVVAPLLQVFEFFAAMAEDQTGIPRWAYGNTDIGGAGATSSGLSMLMTNASRGIKEVVTHIDKMIKGCIERQYDYNMAYDPDETLKGDCKIMARGSSSLLAKEQKLTRRTEFLAATGSNPTDIQLIGLENRAKMLIQQAKDLDLEVEMPEELETMVEQLAQQFAMAGGMPQMPKGQAPTEAPKMLDNSGAEMGGGDSNLFQDAA